MKFFSSKVLLISLSFILGITLVTLCVFYPNIKTLVFLNRSQTAWNQQDFAEAEKWAILGYYQNPQSVRAAGMLGDLSSRSGSVAEIIWRKRLVQLEPKKIEHTLAWAQAALTHQDARSASYALNLIADQAQTRADYHSLLGMIALQNKDPNRAEVFFQKALSLEPNNPTYKLNLALLQLNSTDLRKIEPSASVLLNLAQNSTVSLEAKRALLIHHLKKKNVDQALLLAHQIQKDTTHSPQDELVFLKLLHSLKHQTFQVEEEKFLTKMPNTPQIIAPWMNWMLAVDRTPEALSWLNKQEATIKNLPEIKMLTADAYTKIGDWENLESYLKITHFGHLEFIKELMLIHTQQRAEPKIFLDKYVIYLKEKNPTPSQAALIAQVMQSWGYSEESNALWWKLAKQTKQTKIQAKALEHLRTYYRTQKNTLLSYQVEKLAFDANPSDAVTANNYAYLSLLLGLEIKNAAEITKSNFAKYPKHPISVSMWAFTLYTQGKFAEGLKIIETLSPAEQTSLGISLYYGILLAENGYTPDAKKILSKVTNGSFFPEELLLLNRYL